MQTINNILGAGKRVGIVGSDKGNCILGQAFVENETLVYYCNMWVSSVRNIFHIEDI